MTEVDRTIEELYGVPPKEFSAVRNAKAAELKAAGHVKEAEAVRRLGKPSPFLWAINQLARRERERLAHFVDVVRRVRQNQLRDPRTAADGMRTIRGELQVLTHRAAEFLARAGYRVSPSAAARISNTLLAAAVDADLVDDLRHGRLSTELAAPGFEVLAGADRGRQLHLVHGGKSSEVRGDQAATPADTKREYADTKRAQAEAQRERMEARRQQAEARRAQALEERRRLAEKIEALRRDAEMRQQTAERVAEEVRELERRVTDARRNLRVARREAARAAARVRRESDS